MWCKDEWKEGGINMYINRPLCLHSEIKMICKYYRDGNCALNIIDDKPYCENWLPDFKSYDVEKVVKQIEELKLIRVEQCHEDYELEVMTESLLDDAIEIVKKGGVK